MSYRLTTEELTLIDNAASMYAQLPTDMAWLPVETVPETDIVRHYVLEKFQRPKASKNGALSIGVATTRTESNTYMMWFRYKLEYAYTEVEIARRQGIPLQTDDVRVGMSQIYREIARLVFQGWDNEVAISGLLDLGEDVDAGLDDDKWNTAGSPITHALEGVTDLLANNFAPPYTWICSWNLSPGLSTKHNAAVDLSSGEYIQKAFNIDRISFLENGTTTEKNVYPLPPATADDAVWVMCKPATENFSLVQTGPPAVSMNANLDRDSMTYMGHIDWHGTVRVRRAGSIVYEPDVDLV